MGAINLYGRPASNTLPKPVEGLWGRVLTAVAAGGHHSAAVTDDGTLWVWGLNRDGQLGLGDAAARRSPQCVAVLGARRVTRVAVGGQHTAVVAGGALYTWGRNVNGQLGLGDLDSRDAPALVVALAGTTVDALALGAQHSVAVADGVVYTWGSGQDGRLGHGTTDRALVPTPVLGLNFVVAVAAGDRGTAAVLGNGTAFAWGQSAQPAGLVGADVGTPRPLPLEGVTAVALGAAHALALARGEVWAWGFDDFGQTGDGTAADPREVASPQRVDALRGRTATAIAAAAYASGAVADGQAYTWGGNTYQHLGLGDTALRTSPQPVASLSGAFSATTALRLGTSHGLALVDGRLFSWGYSQYGQLGRDGDHQLPGPADGLPGAAAVTAIAAGNSHSAVVAGGALYMWGANSYSQLGDGSVGAAATPARTAFFAGMEVTGVGLGANSHGSGAVADGRVYMWGRNNYGQLGDSTITTRRTPTLVPLLADRNATAVRVGEYHSVALVEGEVWTWGRNHMGQLGLGHKLTQVRWVREGSAGVGGTRSSATAGEGSPLSWCE